MTVAMADLDPVETPSPRNPFRIGDRADHKSGTLDTRPVVAVKGAKIRIGIGTLASDWLPAANYRRIPGPFA